MMAFAVSCCVCSASYADLVVMPMPPPGVVSVVAAGRAAAA
jgi:hypothetical protein